MNIHLKNFKIDPEEISLLEKCGITISIGERKEGAIFYTDHSETLSDTTQSKLRCAKSVYTDAQKTVSNYRFFYSNTQVLQLNKRVGSTDKADIECDLWVSDVEKIEKAISDNIDSDEEYQKLLAQGWKPMNNNQEFISRMLDDIPPMSRHQFSHHEATPRQSPYGDFFQLLLFSRISSEDNLFGASSQKHSDKENNTSESKVGFGYN